ncbi:hybrid sensor histidine kinase/response regulator [Aquimarina aggregata]|uniref:hybrid sensor histidine kinase/response regulator n=1 Tax=Aquimarina aggregata TaxID=1642818 RepID=UPI0024901DA9|nr:ATP-binding protein [Aquimarina aggregata]
MVDTLSQKYRLRFQNNMQFLVVTFDGIIKKTDHILFNWKEGSSIFEAHPFFEIIHDLLENSNQNNQEYTFSCVHFEEPSETKICDVTICFDPTEIIIVIFEYTSKYKELTKIAQQKNDILFKNKELELKHEFLLKKEEFKNSLIANINHQIKTPLTGILGFTEILEKTSLNFDQEELINIIKRESKQLDAIVTDMLNVSKIEAGLLEIKKENFDFVKLIRDLEKKYRYLAEEKNIGLEVYLDENITSELIGDRVRVQQILINLLNNAFRYTKQGKISLKVTQNYQRAGNLSINFSVSDSGQGITAENLKSVFDRFTRFHEDKQVTGTGLGLTIVKNLVELMGGDIKVNSKIDEGSTFSLNLPFVFKILKKKKDEGKGKKYTLPDLGRKFRVLLVEDKEVNQFLIMKLLISKGVFFVDAAMNGKEAIKYIEKRKYDVVLMDLMMFPMNGYETTRLIRESYDDKTISNTPIIGFTAQNADGEKEKCLKSGMNDFINKPFSQEDLLNKIYKQISQNNS